MLPIKEIVIYIHGVFVDARKHDPEYNKLHDGIQKEAKSRTPRARRNWPDDKIHIEWGWNFRGNKAPKSQELLTEAQQSLGNRTIKQIDNNIKAEANGHLLWIGELLPPIRKLIIYSFSDMFYYVSEDGKKAVLNTVADQILNNKINKKQTVNALSTKNHISLTILAHSAGSAVAFDLLFYLFSQNKPNFSEQSLRTLRNLTQKGRLRIRRLITFGSPITPLACRSDAILKTLANGKKLNPSDYGLDKNFQVQNANLTGPRWINMWYKDDLLAWPVESLISNRKKIVKDFPLDNDQGDFFKIHDYYWGHQHVHDRIYQAW